MSALARTRDSRAPGPRGLGALLCPIAFRRDPLAYFLGLSRYGPIVRTSAGPYVFHTLFDPAAVRDVLVDRADRFPKRGVLDVFVPVLGNGLLISEGEVWSSRRAAVQPAFTRRAVEALAPTMQAETRALVSRWKDGQVVDASAAMTELALKIVCRTLFGVELGSAVDRVSRAVEDVSRCAYVRTNSFLRLPLAWPSPANLAFRRATRLLDETVRDLLRGGALEADVFQRLSRVRDPVTGAPLGENDMRDEAMSLFLAGHETTASTLAWALDRLGRDETLQRRLRDECRSVASPDDAGERTAVERRTLLDATVSEVLRLYPPAWLIVRRAIEADRIGGFDVPARSYVSIPVHALHRHPAWWDDPERFLPDRFLHGGPRHPLAWLPFGAGPRRCLGEAFARLEASIALGTILSTFRFEAIDPPPEPLPLSTLRPARPVRLRLSSA